MTSTNEGLDWSEAKVAATFEFGIAANPELIQLRNGWIFLLINERPSDRIHPFSIRVHVSKDSGETWNPLSLAYEAGTAGEVGCWEPAAIQIPSGEITLFFANEHPYPKSDEQEISLVRSTDNGLSWSQEECLSFRPFARDGMPVPLILPKGKGMILAIEDFEPNKTKLQPTILFSSMADNWNGTIGADDPRRKRPFKQPFGGEVYAGAPYIARFPSGEMVLSCHSDEDHPKPVMAVYVGDEHASEFAGKTYPFNVDEGCAGQFNSVFIKNPTTVTALSATTINGVFGLWAIDGTLTH